jgi:hypothetical protein
MIDKQKILSIAREVMYQIREILYKGYNTQELRDKNNITVFSDKCPVCVSYLSDPKKEFTCNVFPYKGCHSFLFNCKTMETKPTDKFNEDQLKLRLRFWIKVVGYVQQLNGDENLEDVRHEIRQLDVMVKNHIKINSYKIKKHNSVYNELFLKR